MTHTTLTINLSAITSNYKLLSEKVKVAAVVKADAYGLGMAKVAPALFEAGAREFFVANLDEALSLRKILPKCSIGVFHGLQKGEEREFSANNLTPVLNDIYQIKLWRQHADKLSCIVHFDTGMNRLGLSQNDVNTAVDLLKNLNVQYIMSHLACADEPQHPKNLQQLQKMQTIKAVFPNIPISLANSSGVFLGDEYLFDMARTGIAMYGGNPTPNTKNPMQNVVNLRSQILQIRNIDTAQTVGYGASYELKDGAKIATLPVGYADGYFRSLGNNSFCAIGGVKVPLVGRVSMDLITVDVSGLNVSVGDEVEIIGDTITIDDVANAAGTISYEVLTNLGGRYFRKWV
jgi:alanine racemase